MDLCEIYPKTTKHLRIRSLIKRNYFYDMKRLAEEKNSRQKKPKNMFDAIKENMRHDLGLSYIDQ